MALRHCGRSTIILSSSSFRCYNVSKEGGWLDNALGEADKHVIPISRDLAYTMVHRCTNLGDLVRGRHLQFLINQSGLNYIPVLANHLIRLFASFGNLVEANHVFNETLNQDQHTWNAIIDANAKHGEGKTTLHLFSRMKSEGMNADKFTFSNILKAVFTIEQGRRIHEYIIENGLISEVVVGNTVIHMYTRCGCLVEAQRAFDQLQYQDVVSWSTMISGYTQHGKNCLALGCFEKMQDNGIDPDTVIFQSIIKACGAINAIQWGRRIHQLILGSGLQTNTVIGNAFIDMYAKCGELREAQRIFDTLLDRNVVSWNAILFGFIKHEQSHFALKRFQNMQHDGVRPDKVTFLCLLKACSNIGTLEHGRYINERIIESGFQLDIIVDCALIDMYANCGSPQEAHELYNTLSILKASSIGAAGDHGCVHEHIVENKLLPDIFVGNKLIDIYAKHGDLEKACNVFDGLSYPDVVSWSALIGGYVHLGEDQHALQCYVNMQQEEIKPNKVTFLSLLHACGNIGIEQGRWLHAQIIETGLHDTVLSSSLIDMYARTGSLNEARRALDGPLNQNAVSWGALIAGYAQHGQTSLAQECFNSMQVEGIKPTKVTFLSILKAYSSIEELRSLHEQIIEDGFLNNIAIGNTLVYTYAKCGSLTEACRVFDRLPARDEVSWGAMITGYGHHEKGQLVLHHFEEMQSKGLKPNKGIFWNALRACSSIGTIEQGRSIHEKLFIEDLQYDVVLGNTLVNLYAKCGSMKEAHRVFYGIKDRNAVSWNAMIVGYAQAGEARLCVECFESMHDHGIKPDDVALSGIFTAFSHMGMVNEAHYYFKTMAECRGIMPDQQHITCMIDLLSGSGEFYEVEVLLKSIQPDVYVWTTILNACWIYSNLELGRQCFDAILRLDPIYAPAHVLMSNFFASIDVQERVDMLKKYGQHKINHEKIVQIECKNCA